MGSVVDLLTRFASLNVYRSGDRRAPHKPLLCLIALAHLENGRETRLPFEQVRAELPPLLRAYAPPVKARHQPELPYWHLQSDGVWTVGGADELPRQRGGFPRIAGLRRTDGGFAPDVLLQLRSSPATRRRLARVLLRAFPDTLREEILAAVGLPEAWGSADDERIPDGVAEQAGSERPRRDPEFRRKLLRTYEHRCALTGFRAALDGTFFGVEAAHIHWHALGGPDLMENGLILNPLMHTLFDRGAWTLSDDRRVLVSANLTGSDEAIATVRSLHGRPLRPPLREADAPAVDFIRWHREPHLGGVFRAPSLDAVAV